MSLRSKISATKIALVTTLFLLAGIVALGHAEANAGFKPIIQLYKYANDHGYVYAQTYRIMDPQLRVVCYTTGSSYDASISCVKY